jgi:hypothetical protein
MKWRLLVKPMQSMSIAQAYQAILAGITVSIFTPNRVGEYAGRILWLDHGSRIKGALVTIIGSIAQLVVTLLAGSVAFYVFFSTMMTESIVPWLGDYLLLFVIVVNFTALILYFYSPTLFYFLRKVGFFKRHIRFFTAFSTTGSSSLLKVLFLSLLRFMTYTLQYLLLLELFSVSAPLEEQITLICLTFFTMTLIPSIALAELGIREMVALTFMGYVSSNSFGILSATFVLWFINLAIPGMLGSVLLLRAKIFKSDTST